MTIKLWQAVNTYITAFLKDGRVIEGEAISCLDVDETETGELMLSIENDDGIFGCYESEFDRIEFRDSISGELMVMDSKETDEQLYKVQLAYHSMNMDKEKRYVLECQRGGYNYRSTDFFETADSALECATRSWESIKRVYKEWKELYAENPISYVAPVNNFDKSKGATFKVYKIDATNEEIKRKFYTEEFPSFEEYEVESIKDFLE